MHKMRIVFMHDEYACDDHGVIEAEGAMVYLDNAVFLDLSPNAHCFNGITYQDYEVFQKILDKLMLPHNDYPTHAELKGILENHGIELECQDEQPEQEAKSDDMDELIEAVTLLQSHGFKVYKEPVKIVLVSVNSGVATLEITHSFVKARTVVMSPSDTLTIDINTDVSIFSDF